MNQEQQQQPQQAEEVLPAAPPEQERQGATALFIADLASQLGEAAEKLAVQRDTHAILERMKQGVLVHLHIARPRFALRLNLEALGLKSAKLRAMSPDAEEVIAEYVHLGKRGLLPKTYQDRLANAESSARYTLKKFAFPSHWGAFVPTSVYQQWKEDHARHQDTFWGTVKEIRQHYDEIRQEVPSKYRVLAEDAWARLYAVGGLNAASQEAMAAMAEQFHAEEGKSTFVQNYLEVIEQAFPSPATLEEGFVFDAELSVIPLPSVLAQDLSQAGLIISARAIKDAATRAELERIENERQLEVERIRREREKLDLERQAELRLLNEKQQQERQLLWVHSDGKRPRSQKIKAALGASAQRYTLLVVLLHRHEFCFRQGILESPKRGKRAFTLAGIDGVIGSADDDDSDIPSRGGRLIASFLRKVSQPCWICPQSGSKAGVEASSPLGACSLRDSSIRQQEAPGKLLFPGKRSERQWLERQLEAMRRCRVIPMLAWFA